MADATEDDQQRASALYVRLQNQIETPDFESMKAYIPSTVIPPAELQKCDSFTKLCERLTRKNKISPKNNRYLIGMFKEFCREDLSMMVIRFERSQNNISDPLNPLTCLYNLDQILPIGDQRRLNEFRSVLEKFIQEPSNVIPQQLFYTNAAAGIARPDGDMTLKLGQNVVVSVPEGAVTEKKIIYCNFVEGVDPCLLESGKPLVCYSIPVFLGPAGEEFHSDHPVMLDIAHNIAPRHSTSNIRVFIRQVAGEPEWREGGKHFCIIGKNNRAIIPLTHFSEFVIGVDPSTTTSLPSLRVRMITSVWDVSETERKLIICLVFDSAFMIKKTKQLLREKEGTTVQGVVTCQEITLEPRMPCKIKIEGKRWTARDKVEDVTLDELDMLVFKPISREITMVQKENADIQDSRMCNILITQNTLSQEFAISDDTFTLSKPTADEASTDMEARPEYVGLEKGVVPGATMVNSFLAELDRQRTKFKECIDTLQENHKEQTMTLMNAMQENHKEQTMTLMSAMQENHKRHTIEMEAMHMHSNTEQQKQIDSLQKDLQQQKTEHKKQIGKLQKDLQQQTTEHKNKIGKLQKDLQQQTTEHKKQIGKLQKDLQQQTTEHNNKIGKLQKDLQQQTTEHKNNLQEQRREHQKQIITITSGNQKNQKGVYQNLPILLHENCQCTLQIANVSKRVDELEKKNPKHYTDIMEFID